MRKTIIVFGVILIFCLAELGLAKTKIQITRFGAAPLYRDLQTPEQLKQILIANEQAMRQAINDDFLCQFLYDSIRQDAVEIKEEWIHPGQEIRWMTYAGKRGGEIRILRNAVWAGDKPFRAFIIYLNYYASDEENMYTEQAKFAAPKPCGNFSLLSITRRLIEPEPEEIIEEKPREKPREREKVIRKEVPVPIRPPERLEPEKKVVELRFSLKALYPLAPRLSLDLPAEFRISNRFEDYWEWECYTWIDDGTVNLWTYETLSYQEQDILFLYRRREVNQSQTGVPFGVGAEVKIGRFCLGGLYGQSSVTNVNIAEQTDYLEFEEFELIDASQGVNQYQMKFDRFELNQETSEKFYFRNLQAYVKMEFHGLELSRIFVGAGVDFLQMNHEIEINQETYELIPLEGEVISESIETSQEKQVEWITRPFVMGGIAVELTQGLDIGFEARYFLSSKTLEYDRNLLFQVDDESDKWIILPNYSLNVFLSFSF